MIEFFKSLLAGKPAEIFAPVLAVQALADWPPDEVSAPGVADFFIPPNLQRSNGFPILDWSAASAWVESIADPVEHNRAWTACETAWLQHMRLALGESFRLELQESSAVLSSLAGHEASASLAFMSKTLQRIVRVLDGVARSSEGGMDILIVFDDEESYYNYVSHYYPDAGEFAKSGGMYINAGCGHFATVKGDLRLIEPVIAHEMTHGCLDHLPIPAWLNEGLAVNTEQRLCPPPGPPQSTPQQMHERHKRFWGEEQIQQFWSGKSFLRTDEGNELSYDLARILVAQLSADWPTFRAFALEADIEDAGSAAALQHLGVELGALACALLEKPPAEAWSPDPLLWESAPERGAF